MTLRDALAEAMRRSGVPDAYVVSKAGDGHYIHTPRADHILSDPAFRAALTESIADGVMWNMDVDSCEHLAWGMNDSPNDLAAAIVARMLP
jgi:hypothetical protein